LTGTIKLSTPKNLVVDVTMDCSTVTDTTVSTKSGNNNGGATSTSSAEAASGVHVWLTLTPAGQTPTPDAGVIPINPNGNGTPPVNAAMVNAGDATFCNRDQFLSQSLTNTSTTSAVTLATTLNVESQYSNAFNWVSLPDANTTQTQTVTLWGQVLSSGSTSPQSCTVTVTTDCATEGAASWVGQRTMILTPANTAQNAQF
jgi:hypothetical protein